MHIPASHRMTLVHAGGRWGGTSGCNAYGADVRTAGNSVQFRGIEGTDVGCAPDVIEAERAFIAALQSVETWHHRSDSLVLSGASVELIFVGGSGLTYRAGDAGS